METIVVSSPPSQSESEAAQVAETVAEAITESVTEIAEAITPPPEVPQPIVENPNAEILQRLTALDERQTRTQAELESLVALAMEEPTEPSETTEILVAETPIDEPLAETKSSHWLARILLGE